MKLTISTFSTLLILFSVKKPLLGFDLNSTSSLVLAAGHGTFIPEKTIPPKRLYNIYYHPNRMHKR
jgi:hypothetical protein